MIIHGLETLKNTPIVIKHVNVLSLPTSPIIMHNVSKVSKNIVPLTKDMSLVIDKAMSL
jgi:hypothetical protein